MPAEPNSPTLLQGLDRIATASGQQAGLTSNQGQFQIALPDGVSGTLQDLGNVGGAGEDRLGELTIINNSGQRVWFDYAASAGGSDKQELPDGTAFTIPYGRLSEVTIGNNSGVAIATSDPPVDTLSCYWRGVKP